MPHFAPTILYLCGGLIVWVVRFLAVYGFMGVACARSWEGTVIAGFPVIPAVVTASTVIGIAFCAALIVNALAQIREDGDENTRFIHAVAGLVAGVSILAMLYETAPVFFLAGCSA